MNNEFITRALEEDRYLKALQLIERFEMEIEGELRRVAEQFVTEAESLFDDDLNQRFNFRRDPGPVIAHARINTNMKRVASKREGADNLTLNITLRWLDPAEYGISDRDGALCVTAYKINSATNEDHKRVMQRTKAGDIDVLFCRDAYDNAPGMIYVPVETAPEIRNGFEILKKHFLKFGEEYGVDSESVE